jgi:uncharacterized RDD family membrane protein YckC
VSSIAPGWYKDPAEPTTQRYWDGEGWLGDPLPIDATPPPGPPPHKPEPPPAPAPAQTAGDPVWSTTGTVERPTGSRPADTLAGPPPATPPRKLPPLPPGTPPPGLPPLPPGYRWVRAPGPAPRPHGYPVATPGLRLAARAIDIGLLLLLNVAVNGWFAYRWWQDTWPYYVEVMRRFQANQPATDVPVPQSGSLQIAIVVIGAALWFAYEVPALANNGQTPGKRLVGIRVLRLEQDGPLGFARAIRRWNPMGLAMVLWLCCFVGFVFQFIDSLFVLVDKPLHQALHDKSAGTVVVRTGRVPLGQGHGQANGQANGQGQGQSQGQSQGQGQGRADEDRQRKEGAG